MKYHSCLLALVLALVVSGCATGTSSGAAEQSVVHERAARMDPNEVTEHVPGATTAVVTFQHPVSRVWPLLVSAYSVLEIPLIAADTVNRAIAGQVIARRQFGGRPMELLVSCGSSMTGPNAATYLVNIKLTSRLAAVTPETASLRTVVDASGSGTSGLTVRCSSSGVLEQMLLDRVNAGLTP
jgi:hypothetical protein